MILTIGVAVLTIVLCFLGFAIGAALAEEIDKQSIKDNSDFIDDVVRYGKKDDF